jgi:FMN phosphatase YigB (HAD superfamily)
MRFIKSVTAGILLFPFLSLNGADNNILKPEGADTSAVDSKKNIVLCFDLDDVISGKEKIGFTDYMGLVPRILFTAPKIVTAVLPKNLAQIREQADEIAKTTNGTSNIMHALIADLKKQGYGDLSSFEDAFVKRSLNPFVIKDMISNIKKLKAQGYTVIGATNQDYKQYQVYRKKMKALSVDLDTLFQIVLTTRVNHIAAPAGDALTYRLSKDKNVYVVRDPKAYKPSVDYFKALQQLVKQQVPDVTRIMHTDDNEENILGARAAGLQAFHFKLANGAARKTNKSDIQKTIDAWKAEVAQQGITF